MYKYVYLMANTRIVAWRVLKAVTNAGVYNY
jgi:hypothetical protein